jgi:hypothetical protein
MAQRIDTFARLKSAIADTLNRTDLTDAIPHFIELAEARFNRQLRLRQQVTRATATLDSQYFVVPGDFLEAKSFQINTNPPTRLEYVSEYEGDRLKSKVYVSGGLPQKFTLVGNQFEVMPAPDGEYTGELTYFAKIPALSAQNTTNWLLQYAPDMYLYGALAHSAPYLREDERLATWAELYKAANEEIVVADQRASAATTPKIRARVLG